MASLASPLIQLLNRQVREQSRIVFQKVFLTSDLNATGDTAKSFQAQVVETTQGADLEIYAREEVPYVLYGRGPGRMPPIQAIERYLDHVGSSANPYAVAQKIAKEGTLRGDVPANEYFGAVEAELLPLVETALQRSQVEQLLFPELDASFTNSVRL